MEPEFRCSRFPDWCLVDLPELESQSLSDVQDGATSTTSAPSTPTLTPIRELGSATITCIAPIGTPIISVDGVPNHQPPGGGREEKAKPAKLNAEELQDAIKTASHLKYHSFQGPLTSILSPMSDCDDEGFQPTIDSHDRVRRMPSDDTADLTKSITVNNEVVGQGGYASVYKGSWEGRPVALKALRIMLLEKLPTYERRLRREILVLSMLDHPNITPLFGVATTSLSQLPAIVTPWYTNGSVNEYLVRRDPSMAERVRLSVDVARGLNYLHRSDIVHGDLKPGNILIDDTGNARLCDFGLSLFLGGQVGSGFTTTTKHVGTVRYAAPEILSPGAVGYKPTPASDIFSLGCVIYEFTTKKLPYHHLVPSQFVEVQIITHMLVHGLAPATPSQDFDKLDSRCRASQLWELLAHCWDHNPSQRPSALQAVDRLANIRTIEIDYNEWH